MIEKNTYKRLGDYIREVNVRNRDLAVTKLMGVNINKYFMPSVANVIGTDMSNYKIVKQRQFACNLMHVGRDEKIPMAISLECDNIIVSPAYCVFEVIDHNALLPEYLMMWFSRNEFDRNAWFYTDSDVRGGMSKDDLFDMTLPVPDIEVQRQIVAEYETLSRRIAINEQICTKLEETAQALYRRMFVDNIDPEHLPDGWRWGTIADVGNVITGKTPSSENPEDFGTYMQFVAPGDFKDGNKFILKTERNLSKIGTQRLKNKIVAENNLLVTCIGSDMGKVKISADCFISNQQINVICLYNRNYLNYLYYYLFQMSPQLKSMALGSSTMPMLSKTEFEKIEIIIPKEDLVTDFNNICCNSNLYEKALHKEVYILKELQSLLLSKLAKN